jgi:hypothetical protein
MVHTEHFTCSSPGGLKNKEEGRLCSFTVSSKHLLILRETHALQNIFIIEHRLFLEKTGSRQKLSLKSKMQEVEIKTAQHFLKSPFFVKLSLTTGTGQIKLNRINTVAAACGRSQACHCRGLASGSRKMSRGGGGGGGIIGFFLVSLLFYFLFFCSR